MLAQPSHTRKSLKRDKVFCKGALLRYALLVLLLHLMRCFARHCFALTAPFRQALHGPTHERSSAFARACHACNQQAKQG